MKRIDNNAAESSGSAIADEQSNDNTWNQQEALDIINQDYIEIPRRVDNLRGRIRHDFDGHVDRPYVLYDIVCFFPGQSIGSFTVYIRNHSRNEWWLYNDALVGVVTQADMMNTSRQYSHSIYYLDQRELP
ncbi:hypothetical protein MFLAVUS_006001 [Mucor flavus]|uniref:USP domain-containing protein n=1 Tax=Mucor flavus TaxID=439312 RepID=A0ABP9Z094_9FUNG